MRDSITFGLPAKERDVGGEASGYGGHQMLVIGERTKVYLMVGEDANKKEKLASVANKTKEKRNCKWIQWCSRHGSQRITWPLLKKPYRWWGK